MNKNNIFNRINSIYENLTNSEKKIADTILNGNYNIITMTTAELAKVSETSSASVIRFCKSIGVSSYTELKILLSSESKSVKLTDYSDISPDENIFEIKKKILANASKSIEETVNLITETTIEKTIKIMEQAPLIYTYGIGSSYLVAENIFQKWSRIGKSIICFNDLHHLISCIASAPKNSLVIGISNSGETSEVISAMKIANNRNLTTIGITQLGPNSLNKISDLTLQTIKSKEAEIRSAATSSLMSQFILVDILFYSYILNDYDRYIDLIKASRLSVLEYKGFTNK